jgi:quercetin 2,3-dioxygenase
MSNLEAAPAEVACSASRVAGTEVLHPREVPLGGPRAIRVQRTLPQRQRSLIGAWCFIDHYGPVTARMDVPPHPHTGLQTVSWLFSGEVEHRDTAGVHAMVRPGELNLMTAGAGICHSEVSVESDAVLHGVQLWVALPDPDRDTGRDFAHYAPTPISLPGAVVRVFLGELAGSRSPVHTFTPLLGAQIDLDVNARLDIDVDPSFEHGVTPHCSCAMLGIGPRGYCSWAGPRSPKSW